MKKIISATTALLLTAALSTQVMPVWADTTDTPVDIDKSIYDQVLDFNSDDDTNGDGIISEEEFKKIDFIHINLDNVGDIEGLKKAEGLRSINLSGGSITDFSVLCGLKKLRNICIEDNPVTDVSYFKDMDLNFLHLVNTSVSNEDKISMIQTRDYEIPVGFVENFDLKPSGMLKTQLVIHDDEIAGFGENGEPSKDEDFYNDIIAKKEGETTYSVIYDGKEIAGGKIKVIPSDLKDPVPDPDGVKVNYVENEYENGKTVFNMLTDDKKLYNYQNNKFTMIEDDVKTAYKRYIYGSGLGNVDFILKEDGSFIVNGESVFEDDIKVSQICNQYAITDDGSLWYIMANNEGIEKTKICSDCEKLINDRLVSKKDGTVILVSCSDSQGKFTQSYIYEVGKMNIVCVYERDEFILDDKGNVWGLNIVNYHTAPDVRLYAKNAVNLGEIALGGSPIGPVYGTADGKVFYCKSGEEIDSAAADNITAKETYDYSTIYGGLYVKKDMYTFTFDITVAGVEICNDDRIYGRSVMYKDKSLYMTCLGKHMAVSDVKDSYGAFYDEEANEYSILILRNDNSLWKYCIAADTLTQVTKDMLDDKEPHVTYPEDNFDITDIMSLSQYMLTGKELTDSQIKKYDMNADGIINIIDVTLLKEKLLSTEE